MNCSNYIHNDPIGGSKFISGTTCTGTVTSYTLTLGQQVCMDNSRPLINLNGLVISGDCTGVTPTPTPTPIDFCYISGFSYYDAVFQCPNDGLDYYDKYGVWFFSAYTGSNFTQSHPQLNFTLTNGTDYATVSIEPGQYFTEFVYPKVDFRYTDTGCVSTTYPDWYVYTPATTQCFLTATPTNTVTPTVTPTITLSSSVTPTQTPTPSVTETTIPTVTPTPTNTQTPTVTPTITSTITPTITSTQTPTNTQTQTQTPTNTLTVTPTITSTITPTITSTQTPTVTPTITLTMTPSPTSGPFNPSRISNLQYWFDASSGASVSSWTNYGLLGGSITQSASTLQPEVKTDSFMGAWTGTTMRFVNSDRMTGTFANVNFSASTQFLVFKQVSRATFGDIIGYRIWDGSSNIFSQWLSRTSTPIGNAFNLPFSGISLSNTALVGSPSLISIETSGTTQGTALIDMEINDVTQVMTYSASTAYLSGNTFIVGGVTATNGTNDVEFAELIVYNKVLTPSEFLEVENYLKTKYDYPTWIIPTPTPTASQTPTITPTISQTQTPTITPTNTLTPTITPSITSTINITPSVTLTPTKTQTPTITQTPTRTPTPTINARYYQVQQHDCTGSCNPVGSPQIMKWFTGPQLNIGWYYAFDGTGLRGKKYYIIQEVSEQSFTVDGTTTVGFGSHPSNCLVITCY
jgi:hypothetical protein